jgi:helix-turn-helix protein
METWETLTMSRKEVPRAGVLKAALAGRISTTQGARALELSVRQFQRVKRRFATEGAPGLPHRLRGRPSPRRLGGRRRGAWAAPSWRAPRGGSGKPTRG